MSLNLEENLDIEERFIEYNSHFNVRRYRARNLARAMSNRISNVVGENVLFPIQVRSLAYLLGFEDKLVLTDPAEMDNPFGISRTTYYSDIESLIPPEDRIDITHIVRNPKKGNIAFKRTAVEQAFLELHRQQKLVYSPERFQYALGKV